MVAYENGRLITVASENGWIAHAGHREREEDLIIGSTVRLFLRGGMVWKEGRGREDRENEREAAYLK